MSALVKAAAVRASSEQRMSHALETADPLKLAQEAERLARERAANDAKQVAELERLKEQACAAGLAEARRQAEQEARKLVDAQLKRLAGLIAAMQQAWERDRSRAEKLLGDVAFVAVARVLADTMAQPQAIAQVVKNALESCADWQQLTIEVHAGDLALLEAALAHDESDRVRRVKLEASDSVRLGGCRLKSDEGVLDARLETQLAALRARIDLARQA